MAEKFLKQYEILFKKAKVDFKTAKLVMDSFEKGDAELELEIVMFHLQQSVEKLLKALIDYNNIKFPYTHDIEDLIMLIKQEKIQIIDVAEFCIPLSEYAVEGRYAIIYDDIEDASKYIKFIDDLLLFIKEEIKIC